MVGLAGLATWRRLDTARAYGWLLAVGYGAAFVYGLFAAGNSGINFLSINGADNGLHLVSALAGLTIALWPARLTARGASPAATPDQRRHRRCSLHPGPGTEERAMSTTSIDSTVARTLHDVGLAAWFGGSLMGAAGLNGAAAAVKDPTQRLRVANTGWARWTPLNLAGIAAHLAGGAVLTGANKGRLAGQQGVATTSIIKTALTVAALGATAYARLLGRKLEQASDVPVEGGTTPSPTTPDHVAGAQRRLTVLQWVIPALTGAVLVVNARMGEQQRPVQVTKGFFRRLLPGR